MNVVLIWHNIPDDFKYYYLKDVTADELDTLQTACSHLINDGTNTPEIDAALFKISDALWAEPQYWFGGNKDWEGKWADCAIDFNSTTR